ncbi:MAG: HAD family phosphatase [Bacteroidota bacterium]
MIEVVIFDFGNVLCTFDVDIFVQDIARRAGTPPDHLVLALKRATPLVVQYETGLISTDQFFEQISHHAGITLSRTDFRDAYCSIFDPIPETLKLVKRLEPRYRLGLLSNTNQWHYACAIQPVEVFPLFEAVSLSFEVKAMKPAEPMYHDMLAKLQVPAERCVYIDDVRDNVETGLGIGMRAIHYTSHEALCSSLEECGVRVG